MRRSAQVLTIEMAIASIPIVYFVHVSKLAFGDELFVQQAQPHLHEEQDEAAATPMTAATDDGDGVRGHHRCSALHCARVLYKKLTLTFMNIN